VSDWPDMAAIARRGAFCVDLVREDGKPLEQ
jgi:hypothetical protein